MRLDWRPLARRRRPTPAPTSFASRGTGAGDVRELADEGLFALDLLVFLQPDLEGHVGVGG